VLDVQLHRPYRQAWHAALPDLLAAPREISVWRRLRVDRE
jgi:quinol monooxygenase YgiN